MKTSSSETADRKTVGAVRWMLIALLLMGFFLRLHKLGERRVWWDEGWSTWVARQPLDDIGQLTASDRHPPLYFALLHLWQRASGDSEFGLRTLSALSGFLTLVATYDLGKKVGGIKAGLLGAVFLSVSRFNIGWSQEIRMYALAGLFAALAVSAAIRIWDHGRIRDYACYVLLMSAGLYTLYMFAPVLVAVNGAWILVRRKSAHGGRALLGWVGAQFAVLALFAPWLGYALPRYLGASTPAVSSLADILKIYWTVLVLGIPLNVESYARFTIPVFIIFIWSVFSLLWAYRRAWRIRRNLVTLLLCMLAPLLVTYTITLIKSFPISLPFAPRYLIMSTVFYSVILGWGLTWLSNRRRWAGLLMGGVVLVASLVGLNDYYYGRVMTDDYRSLTSTLQDYARPEDAVILYTDTDWPIFAYHFPQMWAGVPNSWQIDRQIADNFLLPLWEANEGIWLVTTPYAAVSDPLGQIPAWLAEKAEGVTAYKYVDKSLVLYTRTPERAKLGRSLVPGTTPAEPLSAVIGSGALLTGFYQPAGVYHSGETIHLFLFYQVAQRLPLPEVKVELVNRFGDVWDRQTLPAIDSGQPGPEGLVRQQLDFVVPPEAPTDQYAFEITDVKGEKVRFGQIELRQKITARLSPADIVIENPLDVRFDQGIRLLGYDLGLETARPGGQVFLTLYWQSDGSLDRRYKVFTHLVGAVFNAETSNFLWGQQDNEPVSNSRPTTGWIEGEIIVDQYAIPFHPSAPDGEYHLEVGMYLPLTGERLTLDGGSDDDGVDHLILDIFVLNGE